MPLVTPLKSSVNAGEFSARMAARSDFALYPNAAKVLENMLLTPQGAATRRPGTHFVAEAKAGAGPYRLIPFERSADQAYVIEVGQGYMRFFTDHSFIEQSGSPGTPYEIVTPYTSFDPFLLNYAQQDDIMILVHPDFPPQQLSRFADDNWTISETVFETGPFLEENETSTTVIASATTGTVTLTASAALWEAGHVGGLFALGTFNGVVGGPVWAPGQAISIGDSRRFEGRVYIANTAGTTGIVAPVHEEGVVSDGGVDLRYIQTGLYGIYRIDTLTSSTQVTATILGSGEALASSALTASTRWRFGAWSEKNGYPRAVTLLDSRAWYAGTATQPQTAWASKVLIFDNFFLQGTVPEDPITDDGTIEATLQSSQVSAILWLMVRDDIIAGTTSGPWRIRAVDGGIITPRNIQARRQSTLGCSIIPAREVNSSLLFVPRGRRQLHDLRFDFDVDKFEAVDQTLLSSDILLSGAKEIAYQAQPFTTLWVLRDDGVLSTFTFNRAEQIRGWSRQIVSGVDAKGKSVTVVPGDSATDSEDRDEVWVAVERTIDGSTVTYIEFFEGFHEETDAVHEAWHLDSALQYTGVSTTSISGLGHLEGEVVSVWGDSGADEADKLVSAGAITLNNAVTSAVIGLPTSFEFETLPFDVGSPTGTALSKRQKFSEVRAFLYLTTGLRVSQEGVDQSDFYDIERRIRSTGTYDRVTGTYGVRLRDGSFKHNPTLKFTGNGAGPCTILGLAPFITTQE